MSTVRVLGVLLLCAHFAAGAQTAASVSQSSDTRCPDDVDDVRLSALSSIMQAPSDQVITVLQKVLERRDECSVTLRRRVVEALARSRDAQRTDLLLRVVRTDPSDVVKRQAVQSLGQANDERSAAALDSIVFNSKDADVTDWALRALSQQSNPSARATLRRIADGSTVPIELRVRAVSYVGSGRRTSDDEQFLLGLFGKTNNPELRQAVMRSAANLRTPEAAKWLLEIARDKKQEIELRRTALRSVSQSVPTAASLRSSTTGVELKDLLALYDEFAGQEDMEAQLLDIYAQRPETAATDKLLQIADRETHIDLRKRVVTRLGQRRDPRVTQFLLDLLNK